MKRIALTAAPIPMAYQKRGAVSPVWGTCFTVRVAARLVAL